ncbi:putative metallo-beta-lactamase domain protein [Aspergillus affinis]|uniref:putative metallo-beta-lactamase domain protein n=1 Tax=Aspergillus affinis TaxID=1070780 RepID=UPI0022FEE44C|nr:putative metallo-beta-lactamase domain protein [Aspergillus affinis]KAI9039921.1 putative metallo-beta-lactamase domain protein [Aspergillus affinis]
MTDPLDLIICTACGIQYPTSTAPASCKICDDPRQYLPPTGQTWTTLRTLQTATDTTNSKKYTNIFTPSKKHPSTLISIQTAPKLAIGQRALLCRLPSGKNILWDCLTYIDDETVDKINELGGLHAIVISHPHYFSTHLVWAERFGCKVYMSVEDEEWAVRKGEGQVFWEGQELNLGLDLPLGSRSLSRAEADIVAIKTGGHFPGSSVLWWKSKRSLMVADTIFVVPSGVYHVDREPGTTSFSFMWSIPNMIPLPPGEVHNIWKAIAHTDFDDTYGAFPGSETYGNSRERVLESAKIIVKAMGYLDHAIHQEVC